MKAIATSIKKQNEERKFVKDLVDRIGYPLWEKAFLSDSKTNNIQIENNNDTSSIAYIPFAIPDSNSISAVLAVGLTPEDTIFNLLFPQHYQQYGFDPTTPGWKAKDIFQLFSEFDLSVFGHNKFLVTDGRIFGREEGDTLFVKRNVIQGEQGNFATEAWVEVCITYTILECPVFYRGSFTTEAEETICTSYYLETFQGMPGPLIIPGFGGSGSGGSGNWEEQTECPPIAPRMHSETVLGLSCGEGWVWVPATSSSVFSIADIIPLTPDEFSWLFSNPVRSSEILYYLNNSSLNSTDKNAIAQKHITQLINDSEYRDFVNNYSNSTASSYMWWENELWLDIASNFNLDIDPINEYKKLNQAEKELVKLWPIEAILINKNKQKALDETEIKFPGSHMLNDKADAFRHAYFNALNASNILIGPAITLAFGIAHEEGGWFGHQIEREMDLINNNEGINIASSQYSNATISAMVSQLLANGILRYLAYVDYTGIDQKNPPGPFWENPATQRRNDGHHGINRIPGFTTILIPTDQ